MPRRKKLRWKRGLRNQPLTGSNLYDDILSFPVTFCRCNFGPCFHEYCGLRVALIWICQTLCGVYLSICLACLMPFLPWHWIHHPTQSLPYQHIHSSILLFNAAQAEKNWSCQGSASPLFADGSKSSSLGQLQSRPAALYQVAEGGGYYSYLQSWAYVEHISVFNWAAKR